MKLILALSISVFLLATTSCKGDPPADPAHPVIIQSVVEEAHPVRLTYIGTTGSQAIKKYAFKMPGKVAEILVKKGEKINKGQSLARLDEQEIQLSLENSQLQAKQARAAFKEAANFMRKMRKLKRAGAISQIEYDKARLDFNLAKSNHGRAKLGFKSQKNARDDATMVSEVEGYVVDIPIKKGEVVPAGYPVVIVRNETQVVNVGVSQRDLKKLKIGTVTQIRVDDAQGNGKITNISQIPNLQSRTYNVEVSLSGKLAENEFYIGSIARVEFEIGDQLGFWIPISAIQTDGLEYVFVANGDRVVRKNILLGAIDDMYVRVDGLTENDRLVISGMNRLKEGYKVAVIKENFSDDTNLIASDTPQAEETGDGS